MSLMASSGPIVGSGAMAGEAGATTLMTTAPPGQKATRCKEAG